MTQIRLILPCPPMKKGRAWGDWYFGHSLGDALERQGCTVRYTYRHSNRLRRLKAWMLRLVSRDDVEVVIRGSVAWKPLPWKRCVQWVISQTDTLERETLRAFDHVFFGSDRYMAEHSASCKSASLLLQCTDSTCFVPNATGPETEVLFVGNRRPYAKRDVVKRAIEAGFKVSVWGKGWDGEIPETSYAGSHIKNKELSAHYASARVVLNDHTADMRRDGFVSNRVYDVLASGTPVVTEDMPGIPADLRPYLFLYSNEEELIERLTEAKEASPERRMELKTFADVVRQEHSFDRRASTILEVVSGLNEATNAMNNQTALKPGG